ncbi:GtrA family protein [Alkaliphilus metalliredigens QYMF]|uniref:GtrA family protein n=1 Tax=Alkaliphilus metalliredigens (strain QYMF) TaxID=293826 RepID=A6TK20_ALKMQ|nr:GtrA family protein [Alkaliphilus metalliredigens]ABR46538.1 GtrA family protein [Alkaliphilus metalliredigens QYMF]
MLGNLKHYMNYLIFGVLTTAVNLVIYTILIRFGLHYLISTTIAFILAVSVAFYTNRKWVFDSDVKEQKGLMKEMSTFFVVRIGTYFFDLFGLILLIQLADMDELISKLIVNGGVIVLNYALSKWVVFKKPRPMTVGKNG